MFRDLLKTAFDDMFEHLGAFVQYRSQAGAVSTVMAVIKQPENLYELGDSQLIDQVAEVTVKAEEISPRIGDYITDRDKTYKIYTEPLLDASNYIWKFLAVLV